MKIKALIPVRSGSVRVENKNIRPFAGSNLLEIKIKQLLSVKELDGIVVNSNSDEMLRVASKYPVELVKRDDAFASNTVYMSDVYENMAQNFPGDIVVYAAATYPLISPETVSKIISKFQEEAHDSVVPVSPVKEFLFHEGRPLNYNAEKFPRSQDLPNIVALSWAASVIPRDIMIARKSTVGSNPFLYELSDTEAVDIDTPFDFTIAEAMYQKLFL